MNTSEDCPQLGTPLFPVASGEMAELIRAYDWIATPLGPLEHWPQHLKTAVDLMLASPRPVSILWGPARTQLYNDAYIPIAAERHPNALGKAASDNWSEAYEDFLGPILDRVFAGESVVADARRVSLRTLNGNLEERYFTGTFQPIRNCAGQIEGVYHPLVEITATVRADIERRVSEARYRELFESIESGFCIVEVELNGADGRVDYRVVEANPAFYLQTGFPQSILGRWLREAAPGLEEHWFEVYGRVARTGEPERFQEGSDTLGRWFDVYAFRTGTPEAHRVAILFTDVTARRRADIALEESESRFRNMAEHAPVMMWVTDASGYCTYLNRRWYEFTGQAEGAGEGYRWLDAVHPADRGAAEQAFVSANADRRDYRVDFRLRRADGVYRWTIDAAAARFGPDGEYLGYVGSVIDVEDRREIEERRRLADADAARREADALYRAYFEHTAEALFVVNVLEDGGFSIEDLNPAHQASIGLPLAEVKGKRLDLILPTETAEKVIEHYQKVIETGDVYQYREVFELHGRSTWWDTVLVPVRDTNGRIVRLIGSSRDLTAQVAAEEQLRQSQKLEAMGQLTGGVAHDFNNLLTPIIGALDMLMRKSIGNERERRLIDGALQSAERAKTLVQRLLAFARRQPLQTSSVNLYAVIDDMAHLIGSTIGPTIDLRRDLQPGLPPVAADPNQLEMALLNLAVNARDAMPEGGVLTIGASRKRIGSEQHAKLSAGEYVVMGVTDTGVGMNEDTLARAIEPFFSTKGIGKGTGLGLSMVHGLVAQLGGALTIESSPGAGTAVELWLPVSSEPVPAADEKLSGADVRDGRGTVLLVDDEMLVRMSTADMLMDLGFDVVEAASAEEAWKLIEAGEIPDLLITDHLMPGMSGVELAGQFRAARPDVPVLIISGYAEHDDLLPDLPRLTKPFRNSELAAKVDEITN